MLNAVLRDSLIYGLASVLSKGLAIFLLPLYTRVLSPGEYGAYELLITLGALANLVVALEVSQGLARHWANAADGMQKVRLASTALWFTVVMYGIFTSVGWVWSERFNYWLSGDHSHLLAFKFGLGFIAANGIYYLLLNQFRWELRSKAYMLVSVGYALMTLLFASVLCLWWGMGLEGVMLGQLLAAFFSALLSGWLLCRSFTFSFDAKALRAMLLFSAPLVPAGLAVFMSLYINRFALMHFTTLEDVGRFGVGSRIAGMSALLILGIQAALTPLIYQHYREPGTPAQIAKLFDWFLAVALMGCLFLALFAKELLMVLATRDYMDGAVLVVYLAPALLLSQMYVFAPGIAIHKKTHWQLWVTLFSASVSVAANWLLVPVWGIAGAAVATLLAALVFFAAWVSVSQRLYPIPYQWRSNAIAVCAFVACSALGCWVNHFGLALWLGLAVKLALLFALFTVVVTCRLLPVSDIRTLLRHLLQRVGMGQRG